MNAFTIALPAVQSDTIPSVNQDVDKNKYKSGPGWNVGRCTVYILHAV
jgi:hypothetical protein